MNVLQRNFSKTAGLGVAGATLARARPGVSAVAAAQEPVVPTPVEIRECRADGSVASALEAAERGVPVAGRSARLWTHNGRPGPTLRRREDEQVELELTNGLAEPTNLHFHGLYVSPTGRGGHVFCYLGPGETARYAFTVPQGSAGTCWYHPHKACQNSFFIPSAIMKTPES